MFKVEAAICEAFHMGVFIAAGVAMEGKLRLSAVKIYFIFPSAGNDDKLR